LNPPFQDNIDIEAPIFANTQTPIVLNNISEISNKLRLANDTTQLIQSVINPLSFTANYVFRKTGWQNFQDSLQVFVEDKSTVLQKSKQIQENLLGHQNFETTDNLSYSQTLTATLPDWVWYVLIVLGFAVLWLEPKLNF
jgi:hypothetical protein